VLLLSAVWRQAGVRLAVQNSSTSVQRGTISGCQRWRSSAALRLLFAGCRGRLPALVMAGSQKELTSSRVMAYLPCVLRLAIELRPLHDRNTDFAITILAKTTSHITNIPLAKRARFFFLKRFDHHRRSKLSAEHPHASHTTALRWRGITCSAMPFPAAVRKPSISNHIHLKRS
jgi:hypothetical protein